MKHIITKYDEDEECTLYWSASEGWSLSSFDADKFTDEEKARQELPEGGEWDENCEDESDLSFSRLWAHKPRTEPTDSSVLLDCDPRLGHVTEDEFWAALAENRLWTVVATSGDLFALPGYSFVNRMSYSICEIPFTDEEESFLQAAI